MTKIEKPVFTSDELDETKTGIHFGCDAKNLKPGLVFIEQPTSRIAKIMNSAKERVNGIARKRHNHAEIKKFASANFYVGTNEIWFGVKYSPFSGLSQFAQSTKKKYEQLLKYYLYDSGWENIKQDKISGHFIVPLNNQTNLENFLVLSQSIGFDSQSPLPEAEDIQRATSVIKYTNRKNQLASRTNTRNK